MHISVKNKYNRIIYYIQNGINPKFPTVTASDGTIQPSETRYDTIRYHTKYRDTIRYNTIRKCFNVCQNRKQACNSAAAHHWCTVFLPINTVAAAGAWILAVWRGDGRPVFLEVQVYSAGLL